MTSIQIAVKQLYEDARIPTVSHIGDAGNDLYAYLGELEEITIAPHTTTKIGTGIAMAIPEGYWGGVFARSGLATKEGLRPANGVGIIDSPYRGEIIVAVHNDTDQIKTIKNGDKIAQLVILPVVNIIWEKTKILNETDRGNGGFGSTGR